MEGVMRMNIDKSRGRPMKRWLDAIKSKMRATSVCVGYVEE